jgi:hypothetical protein
MIVIILYLWLYYQYPFVQIASRLIYKTTKLLISSFVEAYIMPQQKKIHVNVSKQQNQKIRKIMKLPVLSEEIDIDEINDHVTTETTTATIIDKLN